MEASKNDWKLLRTPIGEWQESYMEHLVIAGDIYEYRSL